jgi:uncharacterized protein YndB with AHSA1/START domain
MVLKEINAVEREIQIAAPPDIVFPYFTDPQKLLQWKGIEARLDPQPGGEYWVNVNGDNRVRGEYLEITPVTRVVFTWGWEGGDSVVPPGASTVEVSLQPQDGGTHLRLLHRNLPTAEVRASHAAGWDHFLERLTISAAGGDPGPDPWADPSAKASG